MAQDLPRIISVDDHVVEPPTLWTDRLPKQYLDRAPRVERDTARFHFEGGVFSYEKGVEGGELCDWWLYDDLVYPFPKLSAALDFEELDVTPVTYDEIRPGCWIQKDRLVDMTANHVEASIWSNGCRMLAPCTFLRPCPMTLPPMLDQISSRRYHDDTPSIVRCSGTRSRIEAGTREVHRSGGSVKCASQSMMRMSPRTSGDASFAVAVMVALLVVGPSALAPVIPCRSPLPRPSAA